MTNLVITGTADEIIGLFCGPQDHNEHTKGWRWHLYMQDAARREAAVRDWAKQHIKAVNDAREAREAAAFNALQAAE